MASIHFVCPVCQQNLKVSATLAGRKGRCPFCSAKVRIPVNDYGEAEILDPNRKPGASDIAAAPGNTPSSVSNDGPEAPADPAGGVLGPSVVMHPDMPSMAEPTSEASAPPAAPAGGDLQSQFDRELAGAGPEHAHASEAATVRYGANQHPSGAQAPVTPMPPIPMVRLQPNAPGEPASPAGQGSAEPPALESAGLPPAAIPPQPAQPAPPPAAPPGEQKIETIKYDAAHNPARMSGEQRTAAVPTASSGDRFVETRERPGVGGGNGPARPTASVPPAATPTRPPPDLPEIQERPAERPAERASHRASRSIDPAAGSRSPQPSPVKSTTAGPAAIPPVPVDLPAPALPTSAAGPTTVGDFFAERSDNVVGDGLASLPKERTRPTSAIGALAARGQTPSPMPAAVPVASMETPALAVRPAPGAAAGSLIGDRCDPSRHGQSAVPVILWIVLVVLSLGGVTAWLVVDGLHRRSASIQASQAFLRLSDLASAQGEYFNAQRTAVAGPSVLATAPTLALNEKAGGEYATSLAALQEKKCLNPVLWNGVGTGSTPGTGGAGGSAPAAAGTAGPVLAEANGYRYVLWRGRQLDGNPAPVLYGADAPGAELRLTRGFAVAAFPVESPNWAYAMDDRGRMIQWRYVPGQAKDATGAGASAGPPAPADPVQSGLYPADSDFAKIPIR